MGGPAVLIIGLTMPDYNNDNELFITIGAIWVAIEVIVICCSIFALIKEKAETKEKLVSEQKALESQQRELANLVGLEKMHKMNQIRIRENEQALKSLKEGSRELLKYSIEKEKDWATMGGLASGIAGPAAGLAAAVDTMNDNQRIRAENEKKRQNQRDLESWIDGALLADSSSPGLAGLKEEYITYFDLTPKEIFSKLEMRHVSYDIDKVTGAITISVELYKDSDINMCFDGSIKAVIKDSYGNHTGDALLVLPQTGINMKNSYSCKISGICTEPHQNGPYNISFEPVKLWELYSNNDLYTVWLRMNDDKVWQHRFHNDELYKRIRQRIRRS